LKIKRRLTRKEMTNTLVGKAPHLILKI